MFHFTVALTKICITGTFTPPGSPPKGHQAPSTNPNPNPHIAATIAPITAPPQDPNALLAVLAGLAPQQNSQTNPVSLTAPSLPFPQNAFPPPPGFVPPPPPPMPVVSQPIANPVQSNGIHEIATQILQGIAAGTVSQEQGVLVLNMLASAQNAALPPPQAPQALPVQNGAQAERYEQNGSRFRDRSRSPDYNRRHQSPRRSPPLRRDSPTYGVYNPNAGAESNRFDQGERGRGRGRNRGGRNDRNEYRQRTPPPPRYASPAGNASVHRNGSKFIEWDSDLPRDHIRVLSRTLFIGGASGTESEIRNIFSQFGQVQSCIVNQEKRHAFVKMLTRPDALAAKAGMVNNQDPVATSKARQVGQ